MNAATMHVDISTLLQVEARCPGWFLAEVGNGLLLTHLLKLTHAPSAEDLPHVISLWADDLWYAIQATSNEHRADAEMVHKIMRTLRLQSERWPTPHEFFELLSSAPDRPTPPMVH